MIVHRSEITSVMHRFRDNDVFWQIGNAVIVIRSSPGGTVVHRTQFLITVPVRVTLLSYP